MQVVALISAVIHGHTDMVELILMHVADPSKAREMVLNIHGCHRAMQHSALELDVPECTVLCWTFC